MKSCQITLLRHGLCEGEAEGRYIGHTDAPLTEEGRLALAQLREDYDYPPADVLFVSPFKRCRDTASLLYPGKTAAALAGLREYFFGEFENKSPQELENHPLYHRWLAGEPGLAPPFAEDLQAFQRRICGAFTRLADGMLQAGVASGVVITHGGVVMALLAAFGLPEAPMHEWLTPGGCGFTLRVEPSIWLRGRKCEVFSQAPGDRGREAGNWNERMLWLELERTDFV